MRLHSALKSLLIGAATSSALFVRRAEISTSPVRELVSRTDNEKNDSNYELSLSCRNSPEHRACWDGEHNLWTNYEDISKVPTGELRKFELTLTNGWIAPDGYNVSKILVNGQYPGPPIEGNWGDTFEIVVHNQLSDGNGTSIHFHGISQLGTNRMDGTSGVVQCPIPPGQSMTYQWRANQYGTSWYHSHFSLQYTNGVLGPLIIHGPTSANYDEEYTLMLSDWYHVSAFTLFYSEVLGSPPIPPSKLLNGKWKFPCNSTDPQCVPNEGGFTDFKFEKGKKYKLRLINTSTTYMQTFWIDGHTFTVTAADLVSIEPYKTDVINIAIGQRYDIIVEANAETSKQSNFWINMKTCVIPPGATPPECSTEDARTGIIRYDSNSTEDPPRISNCANIQVCHDESSIVSFKPIIKKTVPMPPASVLQELFPASDSWPDESIPWNQSTGHRWNMGNETFFGDWSNPTYTYLGAESGGQSKPLPESYEAIYLNGKDEWVYFVINANWTQTRPGRMPITLDHPIHLHGHDFVILAQITNEQFQQGAIKFNLDNPVRRDTAVMPGGGFLVIAFETNNPGAWLMHCHIAFHSSAGFALQFIERESEILGLMSGSEAKQFHDQCGAWREAWEVNPARLASLQDSGA
ncbi:hypothetical protein TWF694_007793 [Orbilia ellipsospora]|uniref:Laccase n=1 Tax=Orbilia ellipsospora TaxID=2528407 RepID=A0AAV9XK95_9PEZI